MAWTQIWTGSAAVARDRLLPPDYAAACTAVETFLASGAGQVQRVLPQGAVISVGKMRVDILLEFDAKHDAGDGEESRGDVCWVVDVYGAPPTGP